MTRKTATAIQTAIRATGAACKMTRCGSGKHVSIGLYGADSERVAVALEDKGYSRSLITGRGTNRCDLISMDAR